MLCTRRHTGGDDGAMAAVSSLARAVDERRAAYWARQAGGARLGGDDPERRPPAHYLALGLPPPAPPRQELRLPEPEPEPEPELGAIHRPYLSRMRELQAVQPPRPTALSLTLKRLAFARALLPSRGGPAPLQLLSDDLLDLVGATLLELSPKYTLSFSAAGRGFSIHEAGALVQSDYNPDGRLAVCSLGTGARRAAAFTILRKGSWALYLGLARESADVEREESCKSTEFWGIGSGSGALFHAGRSQAWRGAVSFGCGDTLEMMLDCSVGALHVKKNGARLGSITERAWRWGRDSELRWALACNDGGWAVRVAPLDPTEF